jgi:hypothetical protein
MPLWQQLTDPFVHAQRSPAFVAGRCRHRRGAKMTAAVIAAIPCGHSEPETASVGCSTSGRTESEIWVRRYSGCGADRLHPPLKPARPRR